MTYQEIIDNITNDTVDFISKKTEESGIDPSIIMEIMSKTITEINYNTLLKALKNQRDINAELNNKIDALKDTIIPNNQQVDIDI